MSVIEGVDYLPELALLMIRKAAAMAAKFEDQALDEMTKVVTRRLRQGTEPRLIVRQLEL
ncbi:hypothetical protein [Aquipseudomonas alcaligenes]|uniref:hypothetical protein n=1 Tax=Aquipseudomonas alcaligenes TaxID=43263 RepID=UPI0011D381FA|nr:MAG: hypothetical protein E6Q72_08710 [Pseudomonas sp.]